MKRLISWVLLLAMCLSLFAGCGGNANNTPNPTDAPVAGGQTGSLEDAVAYVKAIYKNAGEMTAGDFQRIGVVPMGGTRFEITWTANVSEDLVKIVKGDDGMYTIDVNEDTPEEVAYVLTATITAPDGASETLSWEHVIPASVGDDMGAIVDMGYNLADGQSLPNEVTLTGVIISVDTAWSADYKNITVTIQVADRPDKPIQCYRLKGEGAEGLKVGDTITVTGILKNYKGTIEFDAGCNLDSLVAGEGVEAPSDPGEILRAAFALEPGKSLPYTVSLTGKVIAVDTPWSDYYKNISVIIEVPGYPRMTVLCYRLKGEGAEDLFWGDTITVTGMLKNYKGTIEFDAGCVVSDIIPGTRVQGKPFTDVAQIMKMAEALETDETMTYPSQLTGVVTKINTPYNESKKNITVTMTINGAEGKSIKCFQMTGEEIANIKVGDTITVTGYICNYKGSLQFSKGCVATDLIKGEGGDEPEAPALSTDEIIKGAYGLANGDYLDGTHTLSGTITKINTAYSEQHKNITVTIAVPGYEDKPIMCFRMKGEGAADLKVGDYISVTGQLCNYKGTVEFDAGCTFTKAKTMAEIVKEAYDLAPGEYLDGTHTLIGVITSVDTAYHSYHQNVTVTIQVPGAESMPIQCFRLKGEGADVIGVGDTITVTGQLCNYKGKIEFDAGCVLNSYVKAEGEEPEVPEEPELTDPVEIVKAAYALEKGASLTGTYTLTGTIISVDTAYSSTHKNVTVTIQVVGAESMPIQCYRLKGTGAEEITIGYTVTVTGTLQNFNGKVQFNVPTLDSFVEPEVAPEILTDPVEIVKAAYALSAGESLPVPYTLTGVISEITSPYSDQFKNITLIIKVPGAEDMPITCYRLKGEGAADLKVGDTITVTGTLSNYDGTIEYLSGCTFEKP